MKNLSSKQFQETTALKCPKTYQILTWTVRGGHTIVNNRKLVMCTMGTRYWALHFFQPFFFPSVRSEIIQIADIFPSIVLVRFVTSVSFPKAGLCRKFSTTRPGQLYGLSRIFYSIVASYITGSVLLTVLLLV